MDEGEIASVPGAADRLRSDLPCNRFSYLRVYPGVRIYKASFLPENRGRKEINDGLRNRKTCVKTQNKDC